MSHTGKMLNIHGRSRKLKQELPRNLVAALTSFASLWLLEISWLSSILVLIVVVVLMQLGRVLGASAGFGEVGVGAGIVLGVGILVFSGQLLLLLGVPARLAHWTILIFMGICALGLRRTSLATPKSSPWNLTGEVLFCLAIALLVMAVRHPWLLSFAIPVFVLERHLQSATPRRNYIVLLIGTVAMGWIIAQQLRPERWWYYYQTGDANFFESLSWSIAQWGVLEHPGNVGGSIANYHWLSYAFFGQLSQLALLNPWDALMKIGQPIIHFAVASSLMTHPLSKERSCAQTSWYWSAALLIAAAWTRVDSATFGLMTGLVLIALTLKTFDKIRPTFVTSLVLLLASSTVILSKAPVGLTVGATISIITLIRWWHQRQVSLLPLISFTTAGGIAYLGLFRGSRAESTLQLIDLRPSRVFEEVVLHPLLGVTTILFIFVIANRQAIKDLSRQALLAVAATLLISLCITPILANSDLFIRGAIFFLASISIWGLHEATGMSRTRSPRESSETWQFVLLLPIFVLVGSFVYPVVLNRLDRIARIQETVGDSLWQVFSGVFPYFIVFLLLIAVKRLLELNWSSFALKLLSVTIILALIGGLSLDRARRVATWGPSVYTNWTFNDSPFPSDHSRSVGQYIRNNTSPSVVLASNDFCCFGVAWWDEIREDLAVEASDAWVTAVSPSWWQTLKESPWGQSLAYEYPDSEDMLWQNLADIRWGGDNYHLSAESRRRFLLLGLKFQTGGNAGPTPDQILRMTLSLQFANSPTTEIANALKSYGVSGYVANLGLTEHRDWSDFAIEKFRNGNFVYLELK